MTNTNLAMAGRTGRVASRNASRDSVGNRAGSGTRATTNASGGMIRSGSNSRPQTATAAPSNQKDLRNALEEIT